MKTKVKDFDYFLARMMHFCAYQERCTSEVCAKLEKFDISEGNRSKILKVLNDESYLDDKRFVKLYAYSKHKHNNWGKIKIKSKLIELKLSESLISIGLEEINLKAYKAIIKKLSKQKFKTLKNRKLDAPETWIRISRYLESKGYEYTLINETLKKLIK